MTKALLNAATEAAHVRELLACIAEGLGAAHPLHRLVLLTWATAESHAATIEAVAGLEVSESDPPAQKIA